MIDRDAIDAALRRTGRSLDELLKSCSELVVFGSRATSISDPTSDWDLLAIGEGTTTRGEEVDVVWVRPDALPMERWLTSELANHVARYGVWLKGEPSWTEGVRISTRTCDRKAAIIDARLAASRRVWDRLGERSRDYYRARIRRDSQRLALLREGHAVPPRGMLDRAWQAAPDIEGLARRAGLDVEEMQRVLHVV